jgi:hypothetical protein
MIPLTQIANINQKSGILVVSTLAAIAVRAEASRANPRNTHWADV